MAREGVDISQSLMAQVRVTLLCSQPSAVLWDSKAKLMLGFCQPEHPLVLSDGNQGKFVIRKDKDIKQSTRAICQWSWAKPNFQISCCL